jgi:hypothetical protein
MIKNLPLNLSINLTLLFNNDIDNILIESYKYNEMQRKIIIKTLKTYIKKNKKHLLYFIEYNGVIDKKNNNITDKIENSFMNGISLIVSNTLDITLMNNKHNKNKDFIYLIEYKIINCDDIDDCILKQILCNSINEKIIYLLQKYQLALNKIYNKKNNKIKIELVIQYMNKKIIKTGPFEIVKINTNFL